MKAKLTTLVIMTLIQCSTLYSQGTNDSLKCFTYPQAKELLKLALKGEKVDSLIYFYEARIDVLNDIVDYKDEQLLLAKELINDQSILISDLQAKLSESERKRLNLKRGAIALIGAIGIETLFLILK